MKLPKQNKYFGIPGWEIVWRGMKDISQGKPNTANALLVYMAAPRLRFLGFDIPEYPLRNGRPHLLLYGLLRRQKKDAHSQYNALQRRLVSFCSVLESIRAKPLKHRQC